MKTQTTLINNIFYPIKKKMTLCACGCGKEVINEKNRFINGHNKPMLGKKHSIESNLKNKISNTGKIQTQESILKRKISNTGKKRSEDFKLNQSKLFTGRIFSSITIEKMKKSAKLRNKNTAKGWHHTAESKQKLSKFFKGRNQSKESIEKRIISNTGKKRTPESRFKMSISAINYLNNHSLNGKKITPRIGDNEIPIIFQIEQILNIKGISNNRDLFLKCSKWPDRYYDKYNLCVEILEPWHFKSNGELSNNDRNRELIISWKLGCMIYYISEQEFLKEPEKEIQRLKDFLVLLDQGRN